MQTKRKNICLSCWPSLLTKKLSHKRTVFLTRFYNLGLHKMDVDIEKLTERFRSLYHYFFVYFTNLKINVLVNIYDFLLLAWSNTYIMTI